MLWLTTSTRGALGVCIHMHTAVSERTVCIRERWNLDERWNMDERWNLDERTAMCMHDARHFLAFLRVLKIVFAALRAAHSMDM